MTEPTLECAACRRPKGQHECPLCQDHFCRNCVRFRVDSDFEFAHAVQENLSHSKVCMRCFDEQIAPELSRYEETLERAKQVIIITSAYRGHTPVTKKALTPVVVENCHDRDETILRLAYQAADQGFNGLIQTEVTAKKIRNHGHQKSEWNGRGLPAQLDENKLRLDEMREEVWRSGN